MQAANVIRAVGCVLATLMLSGAMTGAAVSSTVPAAMATAQKAQALCSAADTLRARKQNDAARKAYVDAVRADPAVGAVKGCARTGFEALDKKPAAAANPCATADALRDARQDADAKSEYIKILKANPDASCASDQLKKRRFGDSTSWLDGAIGWALDVGKWIAAIVVVLAALLFVLAQFTRSRKVIVKVGRIDRLLAPRVALQALDDGGATAGSGAALSALVRDELTAAANASHGSTDGYRLDRLAAGSAPTAAVDAVAEISPTFKAAAAVLGLIQWLLPRARLTASGTLQVAGPRGEGAAVQLEGGAQPAAATLWLSSALAPPAGASAATSRTAPVAGSEYQALTVPVAAWIDWEIRAALSPAPVVGDARTFALFKGAEVAERQNDDEAALRLYAAVVAIDPGNISARVNHANLRARHREEYLEAIFELHEAVMILRYGP